MRGGEEEAADILGVYSGCAIQLNVVNVCKVDSTEEARITGGLGPARFEFVRNTALSSADFESSGFYPVNLLRVE